VTHFHGLAVDATDSSRLYLAWAAGPIEKTSVNIGSKMAGRASPIRVRPGLAAR
jgi:hypothetical protein